VQRLASIIIAVFFVAIFIMPVGAITNGTLDNGRHPNVGALIAVFGTPPIKQELCSGTLISPTVFLTAGHCTAYLESLGTPHDQVWVSFDEDVDPVTASTNLIQGTWYTDPNYNQRQSDPQDLAVVILQTPSAITPAQLPNLALFDELAVKNGLKNQNFTAVGYGDQTREVGHGPPRFPFDGQRWMSVSEFNALNPAWLRLSQNLATGNGGTCYGDSGGPNFLGAGYTETNTIAAITVTGDTQCVATNVVYRLDTATARAFLGLYVTLS
jgi:secreted trypsin-like serine protease